MSAHIPAEVFDTSHQLGLDRANIWRGRCMNLFARGERVVTQALTRAGTGKLPQLLGQKVDRLAKQNANSVEMAEALECFRLLLEFRNLIVHAEARIFTDQKGWIAQFSDCAGQTVQRVSDGEGEALRRKVQQAVDRLSKRLEPNSRTPGPTETPCA